MSFFWKYLSNSFAFYSEEAYWISEETGMTVEFWEPETFILNEVFLGLKYGRAAVFLIDHLHDSSIGM